MGTEWVPRASPENEAAAPEGEAPNAAKGSPRRGTPRSKGGDPVLHRHPSEPLPCARCGDSADTAYFRIYDGHHERRCWDARACQARYDERELLNTRISITPRGLAAIAEVA